MTPAQVSRWVHSEFRGMHRTRLVTLSAIVMGFLQSARLGVAAIGRGIMSAALPRYPGKDRRTAKSPYEIVRYGGSAPTGSLFLPALISGIPA